jgi:hypothetical protein
MWRPSAVDQVNATLATSGWLISSSPCAPPPTTTAYRPSGSSACAIAASRRVIKGVVCDGLITKPHPAAKAGASLLPNKDAGKFHGTTAATTPTGRYSRCPSTPPPRDW